ncbi:MAG: hypothetical protein ABIA78_00115 [archaeon]
MGDHNNFQDYFPRGRKRRKEYKSSKETQEIIWCLTEILKEGKISFDRQNFYKNMRSWKSKVDEVTKLIMEKNLKTTEGLDESIDEVRKYQKEIYKIIDPFYRELSKRGFSERRLRG